MTSSPLRVGASIAQELDYYKCQYEQLETDLADFQASSKELEIALERDIDTAEQNERKLKAQVEKLRFEVDEWKAKHKQAKAEANSAQNALQKEITALRESSRGLGMRVRDMEVVNDDYERQARETGSSLEDLETKYHVAVEKGVLFEEEIKVGELEREQLRIETQRLRDELGDLKVEAEITREKLQLAESSRDRKHPVMLAVESVRARSEGSERSALTPASPTMSTPPSKSASASVSVSDMATPPSPPLSDAPANINSETKTPMPSQRQPKRRSLLPHLDPTTTPKPSSFSTSVYGPRTAPKHSRGPSIASSTTSAAATKSMNPPPRPRTRPSTGIESLPRSDSLYQMKALRGRMQKIEERVQSAKAKLPAPGTRTPSGSPRVGDSSEAGGIGLMPASVTMRRSVRREAGSTASSMLGHDAVGTTEVEAVETQGRESSRGGTRLSFGIPRLRDERCAGSSMGVRSPERPGSRAVDRPVSRAMDRPGSRAMDRPGSSRGAERPASRAMERPSSRAFERPPSSAGGAASRPSSRTSLAAASPSIRTSSRAGALSRGSGSVDLRASISGPPRTATGGFGESTSLRASVRGGRAAEPLVKSSGTLDFRASVGPGARAPLPGARQTGAATAAAAKRTSMGGSTSTARPRSSMGGSAAYATISGNPTRSHRPSASVSELRRKAATDEGGESILSGGGMFSPPSRRPTVDKDVGAFSVGTRQSGGLEKTLRRTGGILGGSRNGDGEMMPPPPPRRAAVEDVGETY